MRQLFVTPYDIATKVCQAPSNPLAPDATIATAADMFTAAPGARVVTRSPRLLLIDLDGANGLAVSDLPYVTN